MGHFWVPDRFNDECAKHLTLKAQVVYSSLCRRANSDHVTFVGYRRIAMDLGINKDTVMAAIKELEVSGLIRRLPRPLGQASRIFVVPVQDWPAQVSGLVGQKEVFKEDSKEAVAVTDDYQGRDQMLEAMPKHLREKMNGRSPSK